MRVVKTENFHKKIIDYLSLYNAGNIKLLPEMIDSWYCYTTHTKPKFLSGDYIKEGEEEIDEDTGVVIVTNIKMTLFIYLTSVIISDVYKICIIIKVLYMIYLLHTKNTILRDNGISILKNIILDNSYNPRIQNFEDFMLGDASYRRYDYEMFISEMKKLFDDRKIFSTHKILNYVIQNLTFYLDEINNIPRSGDNDFNAKINLEGLEKEKNIFFNFKNNVEGHSFMFSKK